MHHLARRLKERASREPNSRHAALNALAWDYPTEGAHQEPDVEACVRRSTAGASRTARSCRTTRSSPPTGRPHAAAGSTPGSFPNRATTRRPAASVERPLRTRMGLRMAARPAHPLQPRLGAARRHARGANERSSSGGTTRARRWTGDRRAGLHEDEAARIPAAARSAGRRGHRGRRPFILHPDGVGWIWVASGLEDGPLPTHYEPLESPVGNPLYPGGRRTRRPTSSKRPDEPLRGFATTAVSRTS